MKRLHILCKRNDDVNLNGLTRNRETGNYHSEAWDFRLDDARQLIGGKLYLHESKDSGANFGGVVVAVYEVQLGTQDQAAHKERVGFEFVADASLRNEAWQGKKHAMAWCGGIIDDEC